MAGVGRILSNILLTRIALSFRAKPKEAPQQDKQDTGMVDFGKFEAS
jgi:hypothetical protein